MENEGRAIGILPAWKCEGEEFAGKCRQRIIAGIRFANSRARDARSQNWTRDLAFGECAEFWRGGDANNRPSHLASPREKLSEFRRTASFRSYVLMLSLSLPLSP